MIGLMKLQNKRNNYSISHVALIDKYLSTTLPLEMGLSVKRKIFG